MTSPPAFRLFMGLLSQVAPPAAEALAAKLWMSPRRHLRPARELAWLERAEPLEFETSRARLKAWAWGRGPTVLLVHGWAGRGAQLGAFVEPLVEAGYRVVTFDAPAHGDSGGERVNLADFSEAVEEAAWAFGPLRGIVAHSFGCLATCVAMRQGVPADRLVFVAPAVMTRQTQRQMRDMLGVTPQIMERLMARVERRTGLHVDELDAEGMSRVARPALFFHDPQDREIPVERSLLLQRSWPGSELILRPGTGHSRILRDAAVIQQTVGFLTHGRRALPPSQDPWRRLAG